MGTDLSPIQPTYIPPSLHFEIDDAASDWNFPRASFDYIHVRGMFGALRERPRFYQQVLDHLKPGGWYEQMECSLYCTADDGRTPDGHRLQVSGELFKQTGEIMGKTVLVLDHQKDWLIDAGFENVVEHRYRMPIGLWPKDKLMKEIGSCRLIECEQGIEGWALALFTRILGMSYEEVQVYLAEMRRAFRNKRVHGYTRVSVVYGRKPMV